MKALSDPNRVKILKMLQSKTMCVCEMQMALEIAQPTVSNHLKVLEDVGLVGYRKDGLWVNYYPAGRHLQEVSFCSSNPKRRGMRYGGKGHHEDQHCKLLGKHHRHQATHV